MGGEVPAQPRVRLLGIENSLRARAGGWLWSPSEGLWEVVVFRAKMSTTRLFRHADATCVMLPHPLGRRGVRREVAELQSPVASV